MLNIVVSYDCIQFQLKSKNQTWKNGKKPSLGLYFVPLPKFGPQKLFYGFYLN